MKLVRFEMDTAEAQELADFLDGTDMHMSVGDRVLLARKIRKALTGS